MVEDTLKMIDESLQWRKEFNLNGMHAFFTEQAEMRKLLTCMTVAVV